MNNADGLAMIELEINLSELIELGLVEEMAIDGEPHCRLTDAGMSHMEEQLAA